MELKRMRYFDNIYKHLPSASLKVKNPVSLKKAGTLEQYRTIAR
jgi:hypothetical protein